MPIDVKSLRLDGPSSARLVANSQLRLSTPMNYGSCYHIAVTNVKGKLKPSCGLSPPRGSSTDLPIWSCMRVWRGRAMNASQDFLRADAPKEKLDGAVDSLA